MGSIKEYLAKKKEFTKNIPFLKEGRTYVHNPGEAPKGVKLQRGKHGAYYYDTDGSASVPKAEPKSRDAPITEPINGFPAKKKDWHETPAEDIPSGNNVPESSPGKKAMPGDFDGQGKRNEEPANEQEPSPEDNSDEDDGGDGQFGTRTIPDMPVNENATTYWDNNGKYKEVDAILWDKYIPQQGVRRTGDPDVDNAIDEYRASAKAYRRLFNDGDTIQAPDFYCTYKQYERDPQKQKELEDWVSDKMENLWSLTRGGKVEPTSEDKENSGLDWYKYEDNADEDDGHYDTGYEEPEYGTKAFDMRNDTDDEEDNPFDQMR